MLAVPRAVRTPLVLVALLLVRGTSAAQVVGTTTTSFTLHSAILKEDRAFQIYVPAESGPTSKAIYVLDGQAQFTTVVRALKELGRPQHIVIGIGNIWSRDRDYTPTRVSASALVDGASEGGENLVAHLQAVAAASGGGENFIAHLQKELIPYVDSHYAVGSRRILVGHSFGGLLGVSILLNHPGIFNDFVLIDPSLWWDNGYLVQESKARLGPSLAQTALFLAIATSKNKDRDDIDAVRADTTQNTALIRPSVLWLDQLRASPRNGIDLAWRYYKDQEHMAVFQPAVKDGLAFVLR
jgi:predicted alpha/beta superfamily hydrolase